MVTTARTAAGTPVATGAADPVAVIYCANCGARITLSTGGVTKRRYWRAREGSRACPERKLHVGHLPANRERIPDSVYGEDAA